MPCLRRRGSSKYPISRQIELSLYEPDDGEENCGNAKPDDY
jgi:hypothetical protein